MKKIGIITFQRAHNYGAILQAYALQNVLSKNYDTEIIDYRNNQIENEYKILRICNKSLKLLIKSIILSMLYIIKNTKRYIKFNKFIKQNIKLTESYKSEKELKKCYPKENIYITGSDQVWNYDIAGKKIDAYTLNFGDENIKKIAYAASIGTNELNKNNIEKYIKNISKIDFISVREKNAQKYLNKIIDKPVEVTLDPTLLLTGEEWNKLLLKEKAKYKGYILGYTVASDIKEYSKILNYLSSKTGKKIIHFDKNNKNIKNVLRNAYTTDPIEFLQLIKNADYVIATSFHATVFSILFHKKFWIIPPQKTSSRMISLLEMLGLKNRIIESFDEFTKRNYDEDIDYNKIEEELKAKREKSKNWLNNAIKS